MLRSFNVREFHARDFHRRAGEFTGWDQERQAAFQSATIELFRKWRVKHSATLVTNDDYQRSFVNTGFHNSLRPTIRKWKKPYLLSFQHTILDLREYAGHQPKGHYIVPVFDNCQEFMSQARQYYEEKNADGRLGRMLVPRTRREYVQLQAADFLAWEYRVNVERSIATGQQLRGSVLEALEEHMFGAKLWSFDYLEHLRKRVEAVSAGTDPDSVPLILNEPGLASQQ